MGLILAVKTPNNRSLRIADSDREEAMLQQAWRVSMETLSNPFVGLRADHRDFAFRLQSADPLGDATALLARLISDEVTVEVPWHLAACACSGETLAQLSESHALPIPTPLRGAGWRVSDHHDRDPLSWIVVG